MKYLIRSIKYFFYFALLTSLIVAALVATGMAQGDINELFDGGYEALWKMALLFAAVAAVYPKVGFITRTVPTQNEWKEIRQDVITYLKERQYDFESENGQTITFRHKGAINRLTRMFEDRVTLTLTDGGFNMEGLRKDVFRLATGLEYRLNPQQEQ